MYTIGYDKLTAYSLKHAQYLANCISCKYYDLDTKTCFNKEVTPYDFIEGKETGRAYCCFWLPVGVENEKGF